MIAAFIPSFITYAYVCIHLQGISPNLIILNISFIFYDRKTIRGREYSVRRGKCGDGQKKFSQGCFSPRYFKAIKVFFHCIFSLQQYYRLYIKKKKRKLYLYREKAKIRPTSYHPYVSMQNIYFRKCSKYAPLTSTYFWRWQMGDFSIFLNIFVVIDVYPCRTLSCMISGVVGVSL